MSNRLIDDQLVDLVLWDVLQTDKLSEQSYFAEHSRETMEAHLVACRRLAREVLYPTYRQLDQEPPSFHEGRVKLHPRFAAPYRHLVEVGTISSTQPQAVGGDQLPFTIAVLARAYAMAGNCSIAALAALTTGAAHLVEVFGDARCRALFMEPLYQGRWTGTMALTEPHAGSSL